MPESNKTNHITLHPTLDACVETQAKHVYNQTLSELLREPDDRHVQQKLETIRLFLETADFPKLRVESERQLVEGREEGKSRWEMNIG